VRPGHAARRRLLLAAAALPAARAGAAAIDYPLVVPRALEFPRDHGAHPDYRTEWWYLTGQFDAVQGSGDAPLGLQLTFFRFRPPVDPANPSRFAAHQLVVAHAAVADPRHGALIHEERIARTGFGIAQADGGDARVSVDRWTFARDPDTGIYAGHIAGARIGIEIRATPTQQILLQGQRGYSRKVSGGASAGSVAASYYYSEPQLALQARITIDGRIETRQGRGWLDHEWSSTLLPPQAAGWDWGGFNLDDGSALTFFRIRRRETKGGGNATDLSAYAALRAPGRPLVIYPPDQLRFTPLQQWTSPRTRVGYPIAQRIGIGTRTFETRALMADQEFDARASSAVVYWEGASSLLEDDKVVGRGYLELTGYAGAAPGQ